MLPAFAPRSSSLPDQPLPPALPPRPTQDGLLEMPVPGKSYAPSDSSGPTESATLPPPSSDRPFPDSSPYVGGARTRDVGEYDGPCIDVTINFVGAKDLPKMDIIGTADPYFRATIDDAIMYTSTCISNTLTPSWNEVWYVKNVPANGVLYIQVWDKDVHTVNDELIGKCQVSLRAGEHCITIYNAASAARGTFLLSISTKPSQTSQTSPPAPHYIFAGPTRYTIHHSPLVGALTRLNDARLYSTWKIHLSNIPTYLPAINKQHWNTHYKAAQTIFQGPMSPAVKESIRAAHRMLYARTWENGFGILQNGTDFITLLMWSSSTANLPKPCMYTYIIDDTTLRFSETGAAFLVDFASKHALHSNCSEYVLYAGEFHICPTCPGGWAALSSPSELLGPMEWELIMDNNSGTYAPDKNLLPQLKELLRSNFPGLRVRCLDREDPVLIESREAMKAYAGRYFSPGVIFAQTKQILGRVGSGLGLGRGKSV